MTTLDEKAEADPIGSRRDVAVDPRACDSDIDEFRAAALRVVVLGLPLITLAIVGAFAVNYYGTAIELALLIPPPLALAVAVHTLSGHRPTLAALLAVAGLFLILTVAVWLQPRGQLATLYCLVVLVAGATLGARAGFATAGVATGIAFLAWSVAPFPFRLDGDVALTSAILSVGSAVLCWVATSPIYVALQWAWQSYDQSRQVTEKLRDRQGELGRVVKSLNEAYIQLEHLNDELAHARVVAEEARKLKAQFAANISHELRTPLNLIIGFSEMMATAPQAYGGKPLPDAYRSDLDAILRNARHLSGLIDDVLDLSQVEAGRMGLVKEQISLEEVIGEATGAAIRLLERRGLSLTVNVAEGLPPVYADRTRIRQVLINLLSNAARFTDQGGITVSASVDGTDVRVSVADTGIGIAPEDIPKAFESFRQIDGSVRRRAGGTGLGLAVSKQFVELHGGAMWAESELGKGTVFHFTLPISANVVATTQPGDWRLWDRVMATRPPEPVEVRVISPDPSVARIFQRYLDGYRVAGYASLADVPSHYQPAPCVVVTPSREEAWQALQTERRSANVDGAPIIVCTLPSRRELAGAVGVAACLTKPVSREQVTGALHQLGIVPRSVLVVDDDADMLRLLGRWVHSYRKGCRVWLAGGGDEAVAILRSRRPDAVLLDLVMPGVDGWAVLREMRADERLRDVPVILVTAHSESEATVTSALIGITRSGGLSVGDLMACLRVSLDALLDRQARTGQAHGAGPVERSA